MVLALALGGWAAQAQVSVSSSGGPSYSQAITVPPGISGTQLNLSLMYAGGGVNGPVGHCGSVQGLSMSTDARGLGCSYREYRTKKDSFARIRAYGVGNGSDAQRPCPLQGLAGQVYECGAAPCADGNKSMRWPASPCATSNQISRAQRDPDAVAGGLT